MRCEVSEYSEDAFYEEHVLRAMRGAATKRATTERVNMASKMDARKQVKSVCAYEQEGGTKLL